MGGGVIKDKMKTNCPFHSCYFCLMSLVLSTIWPHKSWIWKKSVGTGPEYGNKPRIWWFYVNCDTHTGCKKFLLFPSPNAGRREQGLLVCLKMLTWGWEGQWPCWKHSLRSSLGRDAAPMQSNCKPGLCKDAEGRRCFSVYEIQEKLATGKRKISLGQQLCCVGKGCYLCGGKNNWEAFSWQAPLLLETQGDVLRSRSTGMVKGKAAGIHRTWKTSTLHQTHL